MNLKLKTKNIFVRTGGNILSPRGKRSKLLILFYHRVLAEPDQLTGEKVDEYTFDWHVETLSKNFNVLKLSDAIEQLKSGTLPERAVCITFDDGYADNYQRALPILNKWQVPATFFVSTGFLDGGRMWNDTVIESVRRAKCDKLDLERIDLGIHSMKTNMERQKLIYHILDNIRYLPIKERMNKIQVLEDIVGAELPNNLMMNTKHVLALSDNGMEIGAHTITHPILALLPSNIVDAEIIESKQRLEEITAKDITSFAYPNGRPGKDYNRQNVNAVMRAGFNVSVSTAWGYCSRDSDIFQLPRVSSWDDTPFRFSLRMLSIYLQENVSEV